MRTREDKSSPTTKTIDANRIVSFFTQIDKDTGEYAYGMLSKDLYDDNTREAFREILLKEDLSAQFDDDGIKFCDTLFVLLDKERQEKAIHQREEAIKCNKNKQKNKIHKNNIITHI